LRSSLLALALLGLGCGGDREPAPAPQAEAPPTPAGAPAALRAERTSLAPTDCAIVEQDEETGDVTWKCRGPSGFAVLRHAADERAALSVVEPSGAAHLVRLWESISPYFSSLEAGAEWRMKDDAPAALIVTVEANENAEGDRTARYLAVIRVAGGPVCAIAQLRAGPGAEEAARVAADAASAAHCLAPVPNP
jgi:hypothetical protein